MRTTATAFGPVPSIVTSVNMASAILNVKAQKEKVDDEVIGATLIQLGFQPNKDFITIFKLSKPGRFQVELRTKEIAEKVEDAILKNEQVQQRFTVNKPSRTILVSRVFGTITNAELEDKVFPPATRPLQVLYRQVEQKKTQDGTKLWFTGRRFITIAEDEFQRIKHILPSHVMINNHTMFVKFDGSRQSCFSCGAFDHLVKDCKSPQSRDPPPAVVQTSQKPANDIVDKAMQMNEINERQPAFFPNPTKTRNKKRHATSTQLPESKRENETDDEPDHPELTLDTTIEETKETENPWKTARSKRKISKNFVQIPKFIKSADIPQQYIAYGKVDSTFLKNTIRNHHTFFSQHPEFFEYTSDSSAEEWT